MADTRLDPERMEKLNRRYGNYRASTRSSGEFTVGRKGPAAMMRKSFDKKGKPVHTRKTIVKLLKYLSGQRVLFIIAMLSAVLHTLATLAGSYMLRPIMNAFLYHDPAEADLSARISGLAMGIAAMACVYGLAVFTQWLQQRLMLTVSQRSLNQMRRDLYNKLQTLPVRYFDTRSTGDIMSRFANDVDAVGEMLNTTLIQIISGAITIAGTIVLMLYTNWILGLITLVMTPLLTLASKAIIKLGGNA